MHSFSQMLLAVIVGLFAPPIGWLIGVIPLKWNNKGQLGKKNGGILPLFASIVFAGVTFSSRMKFETQSDDFSHYYANFQNLLSNQDALFYYGSGLEIGVPLINDCLGFAFGNLSPWHLMFAHQFIFFGLLLFVINRIKIDAIPKSIYIAFVLVAFPYMLSTQVIRQCYSSIFLFWALHETRSSRYIPALTVAFFFHISALPIYLFFRVSQKLKGIWFFVFLALIAFVTLEFQTIINFFLVAQRFTGQEKFLFYSDAPEGFVLSDILPVLTFLGIFLIIVLRKIRENKWAFDMDEKTVIMALTFSLAALPIPLMGLRVCLMVYLFSGAYLIKVAWHVPPLVMRSLFVALLIIQMRNIYFASESGPFALWIEYPSWSFLPGYFFF